MWSLQATQTEKVPGRTRPAPVQSKPPILSAQVRQRCYDGKRVADPTNDDNNRQRTLGGTAEKLGVNVTGFYYTLVYHDLVIILERSDDAVITALRKEARVSNV